MAVPASAIPEALPTAPPVPAAEALAAVMPVRHPTNIVSGTCTGIPKPSWQSVVGNPADGVRDIPDVSMFAANGIWGHYTVVCWSDPAYTSSGSAP